MKAKHAAQKLQAMGEDGDTILAHINPGEAAHLKAMGGSGKVNPKTGLLSFGGYEGEGTDFGDVGFNGGDWGGFAGYGSGKPGESAMAQAAATTPDMTAQQYAELQQSVIDAMGNQYSGAINTALGGIFGPLGSLGGKLGIGDALSKMAVEQQVMSTPYGGAPNVAATSTFDGGNPVELTNPAAAAVSPATATALDSFGTAQALQRPFTNKFGLLRDQLSTPFTRSTGNGLLSRGGGFFGS